MQSPAFYESANNLSDCEFSDNQVIFNKQMLSEQMNETKKQNHGNINQSGIGLGGNNSSVQSHYMSDRTMNLKKEINSLDDEILQL